MMGDGCVCDGCPLGGMGWMGCIGDVEVGARVRGGRGMMWRMFVVGVCACALVVGRVVEYGWCCW